MTLPALPKKLKRKEADFGILFRRWIEENPQPSGSFELKDTRGALSLPFSALEPDQVASALLNKSKKGNLIRVTTGSPGAADYIYLRNSFAWVVIKYPQSFHIIDVEAFLLEGERSKRKSLTEERAKAISTISVLL